MPTPCPNPAPVIVKAAGTCAAPEALAAPIELPRKVATIAAEIKVLLDLFMFSRSVGEASFRN
jgi:hypothetical protein